MSIRTCPGSRPALLKGMLPQDYSIFKSSGHP